MATQITRLRLFIAIMATERTSNESNEPDPLPNLEGRIVCADTLATVANPDWNPEIAAGLTGSNPQIRKALIERSGVLQMWRDAHSEEEKVWVMDQDKTTRMRLADALRETGNEDHPELMSFARHELLTVDAKPIATDTRLIFYDRKRKGFDIVIGNPPYETIAKGMTPSERKTVKDNLRDYKRYVTTRGNNLYNLFLEVALALAKPEDGVVTMIVPLSVAFAQAQAATRRLFEQRANKIWIRHQDNGPDMTFHESPVANPTNRQRTTIITAFLGKTLVSIKTTGTSQWTKSERERFLTSRDYATAPDIAENRIDGRLAHQWPRVSTNLIAKLVSSMALQKCKINDLEIRTGEFSVTIPQTAYNFITIAPAGKLSRREILLNLDSSDNLQLAMAVLNNHIAYMWWRVWGDAFHVNKYEMTSIAIPDKWLDDAEMNREARHLGRSLINAINPDNIQLNKSGTRGGTFENVNFYQACPAIIEQIDILYLEALGMLNDQLLNQLRKLRSNSNWRLNDTITAP